MIRLGLKKVGGQYPVRQRFGRVSSYGLSHARLPRPRDRPLGAVAGGSAIASGARRQLREN
jgi:hypothetical protein